MSTPYGSERGSNPPPNPYLPPSAAFQPMSGGAFAEPSFGGPPKSSGTPAWVWLLFAFLSGGALLLLVACGGFLYFGMSIHSEQLRKSLNENSVVQEHLGNVREVSFDLVKSSSTDNDDTLVYRVKGNKANGHITGVTTENGVGKFEFISGELELDSGAKFDLFPHDP